MITDWLGVTGHRIPDRPHRPIGLLGAILAWHGRDRLTERPAALDEAREAQDLRERHERRAAADEERRANANKVATATDHPARVAARAEAADAARRGATRRRRDKLAEMEDLQERVKQARTGMRNF